MRNKDRILKEHKSFRNQMIFCAILCWTLVYFAPIPALILGGIMLTPIAIWIAFRYRQNVADKKLVDKYK